MQKIMNGGTETIELLPGAVLEVTALGPKSYANVLPVNLGDGESFVPQGTAATGKVTAGPFAGLVVLRVEAGGRVGLVCRPPTGVPGAVPALINPATGSLVGLVVQPGFFRDGYPDPRKSAQVQATPVFALQAGIQLPIGAAKRLVAIAANATNVNAAASVATNSGQRQLALIGATDAVGMRFAEVGDARAPVKATTGAESSGIVIEIQEG